MAKLYFRYGAMNSGKTTALLQVAHNYEERGQEVIVIKPEVDSKGEDYIVSRLGVKRKVDILLSDETSMIKALKNLNPDAVLIDEAQFLTPEQVNEAMLIAVSGTPVLCYGLRTDFRAETFPGSARLLALADKLEELKTICWCGKKASFNARKTDRYIFEGEQVVIDGADVSYESLCPECYFKAGGRFKLVEKGELN